MTYLIIISIAIIYALIRAKHDSYINESEWKRWAVIEAIFICGIVVWLAGDNAADWLLLPLVFGLWFWIIFDIACGVLRAGKLFYFGSGVFDQKMKRIFQYPFLLFLAKVIWLVVVSGAWLGFTQEYFNLWPC